MSQQHAQQRGGGLLDPPQQSSGTQYRPNSSNMLRGVHAINNLTKGVINESITSKSIEVVNRPNYKEEQQAQSAVNNQKQAPKNGKPPRTNHAEKLDRSMDSINHKQIVNLQLTKHKQGRPQAVLQPQISSGISILDQSLNHSNISENAGPPRQGIQIKGRKMDSPHLVIVKELKDQEDGHEDQKRGQRMRSRGLEDELLMNSGMIVVNVALKGCTTEKNASRPRPSKSQESHHHQLRQKSRERDRLHVPLPPPPPVNQDKKAPKQGDDQQKTQQKTIKSQREVKNQMCLQENQQKEGNMQQNNLDVHNRTTHHDRLQSELSEIHKKQQLAKQQKKEQQRSKEVKENRENSKSRSRERGQHNKWIKAQQAILPKAIQSHSRERPNLKNIALGQSNTEQTPKKFQAHQSFINNEHLGQRCTTSQAHNQSSNQLSLNNNGRALSQPNLLGLKASSSLSKTANKTTKQAETSALLLNMSHHQQNMAENSSPDHRSGLGSANLLQKLVNPNLEWIIKQNKVKIKSKIEEERKQRQESEERQKKKKEQLEINNQLVRIINKEKTYHKKQGNDQQANAHVGDPPKIKIKWEGKSINIANLSQSQKIDFKKIKEITKIQRGKIVKVHQGNRKSCGMGMDFIEVHKEIKEELKTLEHKKPQDLRENTLPSSQSYQMNSTSELGTSGHPFLIDNILPRKLNIKSTNKGLPLDKHLNLNTSNYILDSSSVGCQGHQYNKTERGGSEEQNEDIPALCPSLGDHPDDLAHPNKSKNLLVIKKSKIRKFMEMKKKEKIKEQLINEQNEMLKAIKMQDNMNKLNEFCKKNMMKVVHKKRNATIQQITKDNDKSQGAIKVTSGRKLNFDNLKSHEQQNDHDSSRLSTEFYEEYYKAIKTLKNDKQQQAVTNHSRQHLGHSPTSKSHMNPTITQNQTLILEASKNESLLNDSKLPPKQSKSSLGHIGSQKTKKKLKTTRPKLLADNNSRIGLKNPETAMSVHQKLLKQRQDSKERSESAPLQKRKSVPKSLLNADQNSSRLNNTTLNESMNKKHLGSSGKSKDRQKSKVSRDKKRRNFEKPTQMSTDVFEMELLQIYLNNQANRIQRAWRSYLSRKGFYHRQDSVETIQRYPLLKELEERAFGMVVVDEETVRRDDDHHQKSSQAPTNLNNLQLDYTIQDGKLGEDNHLVEEEDGHSENNFAMQEENFHNEYEDEEEEPDEEEDDNDQHQLIIINEHQFHGEDDKKVVYLSNINSCSLPQTPKIDEQPINANSVGNLLEKGAQKQSARLESTGNYILEQLEQRLNDNRQQEDIYKGYNFPQSSSLPNDISQQRSRDQDDFKEKETFSHKETSVIHQNIAESLINSQRFDIEGQNYVIQTEEKLKDYGMRIFAGSESMLRELKLSTPKEERKTSFHNIEQEFTNSKDLCSKRNMTSQNSQDSQYFHDQLQKQQELLQALDLMKDPNDQLKLVQQHTNTSGTQSSNPSLFERNSFQKYTAQKLQHMIKNNEFLNLIQMREKALDYRVEKERKYIKKMFKSRQFSPRTYTQKKQQLDKWVQIEIEDIQKTKRQFQEEWERTIQMIEETQKNVDIMREQIRVHSNTESNHHTVKYNQRGAQGGDLQSSRNSSASYATTSYKHDKKSILDQDEYQPLSHRSNKFKSLQTINTVKDERVTRPTETTIPHEQTKPSYSNEKLFNNQTGQSNLIDFLEESWKQTLVSQKKTLIPQLQLSTSGKQENIGNRIFIQDQKSQQDDDQIEDDENQSNIPIEESDIAGPSVFQHIHPSGAADVDINRVSSNELIQSYEKSKIQSLKDSAANIPPSAAALNEDKERQLHRSRSEQDIKDLIRQTKKAIQEENELGNQDQIQEGDSSFRLIESERQITNSIGKKNDDIKIQENLFEDSSRISAANQRHELYPHFQLDQEMPSQDSLLNEQELNNYFKASENHKFSIEDFKMLDKRKLLNQKEIFEPEDDEIDLDEIEVEEKQISDEQKSISQDDNDKWSHELKPAISDRDVFAQEFNQNYGDQQVGPSSFLFQNARPGENIKISDILKKSTNIFHIPQAYAEQEYSQFSNAIIQKDIQQRDEKEDKESLASQIADEIFQMLLDKEIYIPEIFRIQKEMRSEKKHSLSPDSQRGPLIVPQRIQENIISPEQVHQQQVLNQDVFVMDVTYNEKEQRREVIDMRQRMLIEADLQRIENYVNEVINILQQHELNYLDGITGNPALLTDPNFHRQFLQVLTVPIKRNAIDVLNQLQTSEIGSYEHFETAMDITSFPILPVDLYLDIERQREEQHLRSINNQDHDIENSVIQESIHIHNKGIFDALNESLMKFRPYGIQGEPMPWSNKVRRLQTKVDTSQVDTERLFFMVKQDVMRWASNCVGCLPTQIFIVRRQVPPMIQQPIEQFDEEIFQETRERRLAQMLASEVVETEHQWLNYEFEESQVKIDLSDMILENLVDEVVQYLNSKQISPFEV